MINLKDLQLQLEDLQLQEELEEREREIQQFYRELYPAKYTNVDIDFVTLDKYGKIIVLETHTMICLIQKDRLISPWDQTITYTAPVSVRIDGAYANITWSPFGEPIHTTVNLMDRIIVLVARDTLTLQMDKNTPIFHITQDK